MSTYDYTEAQFNTLIGPHVDPTTLTEIDNYLISKGFFPTTSGTIRVEGLNGYQSIDPTANVLIEGDSPAGITTDANDALIVVEPGGSLAVRGAQDVGVVIADGGPAKVTLLDSGNDVVWGSSGNDTITAGAGNDTIYGGEGNNFLIAGTGSSSIYGCSGADVFYDGSGGSNHFSGGGGNDTFYGGSGNDTLEATGNGHNVLYAGSGSQTLIAGSAAIPCGAVLATTR